MLKRNTICIICILYGAAIAMSLNVNTKTIKVCNGRNCIKNFPSKYDGGLSQTVKDLLPFNQTSSSSVAVITSGCLSKCQKGPNIELNSRIFGSVDGVEMAAAILEVGADIDYPETGILMASVEGMASACKSSNHTTQMDLMDDVIKSLEKGREGMAHEETIDLTKTTVMAHARILRADLRLQKISRDDNDIDLALEDALRGIEIDDLQGRGWRVVADAKEAKCNIFGAMDAVTRWAESNPSFSLKAKVELRRLAGIVPP